MIPTKSTTSPGRAAALVVLSGGQDSTTCLFWAKQYFSEVHAVTFDYNQRHTREIQAARDIAKIASVHSHEVIVLGPILNGTSPLTNPAESLELYKDHDSMAAIIGGRIEKTFVPMRNALFLTVAANRAVCLGVQALVTGVCQADNANYPDCRETFIKAQEESINQALGLNTFDIYAPLMDLSKAQSIRLAMGIGKDSFDEFAIVTPAYAALGFSHTAYDGSYPPVSKDHANTLRAQGFLEAGVPDPLVIRAMREGLMSRPETSNYQSDHLNLKVAEALMDMQRKFAVGAL